jgi:cation diffusion facilitator family transporter
MELVLAAMVFRDHGAPGSWVNGAVLRFSGLRPTVPKAMSHDLPAHQAAVADRAHEGARMIAGGMALNAALALIKVGGGVLGHAYALVADGVESLTDIAISVLIWAGFQWAARPPDENHPYGHGKAEAVSGLLTALVVVGTGVGVGWHAVTEIRDPQRLPNWWTLLILAGVVGTKIGFSRRLGQVGRDTESTALGAEALHHLSDAMASAAAFVGISIAVVGGPRYAAADGWAALVASAVIAYSGMKIFRKALNEIMDIAVPAKTENAVRAIAVRVPGVASLHRCRVRKSGLSYLVDIQIRVPGDMSVREGHDIAHAVKDTLLASKLRVSDVSVHVEPF